MDTSLTDFRINFENFLKDKDLDKNIFEHSHVFSNIFNRNENIVKVFYVDQPDYEDKDIYIPVYKHEEDRIDASVLIDKSFSPGIDIKVLEAKNCRAATLIDDRPLILPFKQYKTRVELTAEAFNTFFKGANKDSLYGSMYERLNRFTCQGLIKAFLSNNNEKGELEGIDLITTPNTPYAGLDHTDLGFATFDSLLLNERLLHHNPIYKNFCYEDDEVPISINIAKASKDFCNILRDIPKEKQVEHSLDGKNVILLTSREMLINIEREDQNAKSVFFNPYLPTISLGFEDLMDKVCPTTIYLWLDGAIKFYIRRNKIDIDYDLNRQRVLITRFIECNFLCLHRALTARLIMRENNE